MDGEGDGPGRGSSRQWSVEEAAARIGRRDPEFGRILEAVDPFELRGQRPYFWFLCRAILAQQVSTAAARAITERFRELYADDRFPRPESVRETATARLRSAGVSRQKADYLRGLGEAFAEGELSGVRFSRLDDDEVIRRLTTVKGVGRWTAEMFLIFCLRRPDIFPVGDLGIQKGMDRFFEVGASPAMRKRAEPWRPYRTAASLYLWRALSAIPV
jgi:DNA-3-methyladenine glycosylase II